jgi:hypothetical protein
MYRMSLSDGAISNIPEARLRSCGAVVLPLFLTGGRQHIHGADVFDAIVAASGAAGSLRLRFVGLSARPLQLVLGDPPVGAPEICGYLDFSDRHGRPARGWLRETGDEGPVGRLALPDEPALAGAMLGQRSASVTRHPSFTVMKTAVLLAVALLERDMPLDVLNLGEMEAVCAGREGTVVEVAVARRMGKFIMLPVRLDDAPYGRLIIAATPDEEGEPA